MLCMPIGGVAYCIGLAFRYGLHVKPQSSGASSALTNRRRFFSHKMRGSRHLHRGISFRRPLCEFNVRIIRSRCPCLTSFPPRVAQPCAFIAAGTLLSVMCCRAGQAIQDISDRIILQSTYCWAALRDTSTLENTSLSVLTESRSSSSPQTLSRSLFKPLVAVHLPVKSRKLVILGRRSGISIAGHPFCVS